MQFKTDTGKILYWSITVLIFSSLLTPFIVSSSTIFPFEVGKGVMMRILIELALIFYLWFLLLEKPSLRKGGLLFWSVLIYLGVLILTTTTSINPYRSFWGDLGRMEGVFTILHTGAIFFILVGLQWGEKVWLKFLGFSVAVSLLVGLGELIGDKPIFFGNPAFLAVYSLFNLFFAGIILVKAKSWAWQVFGLLGLIINLIVPLVVANRGVLLGLGVAVLVMSFLFSLLSRQRIVKLISLAIVVLVIIGVGFVFLVRGSSLVERLPSAIQKFARIGVNDPSTQTRLIALGVSFDAFKEKPVLGWGPEQFKVAYNKYFNPKHLTYEQTWFDRAHNKVAEVAVNQGIVGLISYLAIFAIAILNLVKLTRKNGINEQEIFMAVILIGLIIAYFVQNLFLFDTPVSYLMLFSSLGFINFLIQGSFESNKKFPKSKQLSLVSIMGVVVASFILVVLIFSVNVRIFKVAQLTQRGINSPYQEDTYSAFSTALAKKTYAQQDVLKEAAQFLLIGNHTSSVEWEKTFNLVTSQLEDFLQREPNQAQLSLLLGKLYNERSLLDETMIEKARLTLQKSLTLVPLRPEVYTELGLVEFNQSNQNAALRLFQKAIDLNPRNPKAHWDYGLALFIAQMSDEGLLEIERAIELGYDWKIIPAEVDNLIEIYENFKLHDKLIDAYSILVQHNPQNAEYKFKLAQAYAKIGNNKKAIEIARDTLQFDSDYTIEIEDFILNLVQQ